MLAVTRKDLATVVRNKGVRIPLIAAPVVILVILPVLLVTGGELISQSAPAAFSDRTGGGQAFADRFTPEAAQSLTGISGPGQWAAFVLQVFLAPLYLLIPLMVATVIAADSFAGERDRGTLEALLHTPTTDAELLTAKFLAAWLPAMVVSLGGFVVYSVVANVVAWPYIGRIFFPDLTWLLLAFRDTRRGGPRPRDHGDRLQPRAVPAGRPPVRLPASCCPSSCSSSGRSVAPCCSTPAGAHAGCPGVAGGWPRAARRGRQVHPGTARGSAVGRLRRRRRPALRARCEQRAGRPRPAGGSPGATV